MAMSTILMPGRKRPRKRIVVSEPTRTGKVRRVVKGPTPTRKPVSVPTCQQRVGMNIKRRSIDSIVSAANRRETAAPFRNIDNPERLKNPTNGGDQYARASQVFGYGDNAVGQYKRWP
jgi:hypothetical protein